MPSVGVDVLIVLSGTHPRFSVLISLFNFLRLLQDMKTCWHKQLELNPWKVNTVILCSLPLTVEEVLLLCVQGMSFTDSFGP